MTLQAGARLGPYEVVSLLGSGGMGEVYRARDTKLGREVALKVLPDAVASDPERLARFEREAQVLAALNHPNIAHIHGFEDSSAKHALVMELVEGPTLADRIAQGPIPVAEALPIARQIAEAFDAAHELGVVHRDLKPANIKVRPDGVVKVLDFGLAKARDAQATSNLTHSPTLISPVMMTGTGVILGTAAYMSPEQARGKVVDKRADIWAFGCVLYEMLTARAVFARDTVTDTLAAIVEREPDWTALPATTPGSIRRLLKRCLEKDVTRRVRDIGDARSELADTDLLRESARGFAPPATRRGLLTPVIATAAVGILLLAGGIGIWWSRQPGPPRSESLARFTVPLPPGEQLASNNAPLALSPNGTYLAFETQQQGKRRLYLRALSGEARVISESSAGYPFFSPDSEWLGFFESGMLKKVSVHGGAAVTIANVGAVRGGTWGDDGYIVLPASSRTNLLRVSAAGGTPEALTTLDDARGETSHRFPVVLPGGRAVVYRAEGRSYADGAIVVYSRNTKQQRVLVSDGGSFPHYSPSGHLLYVQSGNLMAVPFDATTLEVTGTPAVVVEGATTFGLSNTGSLVYALNPQSRATLVWVDRQGGVEPLPAAPQDYVHPELSPDGRRILVQIQTGTDRNIWTYDIGQDAMMRLTFEGANLWSLWTPDGQRVLYASNRPKTTWDIVAKAADGSGAEEAVLTQPGDQIPRSVSPNGAWLAYTEGSTDTSQDIWLFPLRSKGEPRPFARTAALEWEPMFSPDSRWLAYVSNESGRSEVYVRPLEGAGKWQVSTDGGVEPRWGPNGREVFYRNGGKMYAVDVSAEAAIAVGKAHLLFEGPYSLSQTGSPDYDVSRDGRRFLMLKPEAAAPPPVNIVTNWFDELKRLVPTK